MLEVGAQSELQHTLSELPLASLVLNSASVVRTGATETKLFSVVEDLTVSGEPSLEIDPLPEVDTTLFSAGGTIDDAASWLLKGRLSSRFVYEVDLPDGVCRLRKRRGMVLIVR